MPYTPASLMYTHTLETHSVLPEMHLEMPFLLTDIYAQLNLNFCLLIATILCRLSAGGGTVYFKVGARKDNIFLDLFLRYYLDFLPFFFGGSIYSYKKQNSYIFGNTITMVQRWFISTRRNLFMNFKNKSWLAIIVCM